MDNRSYVTTLSLLVLHEEVNTLRMSWLPERITWLPQLILKLLLFSTVSCKNNINSSAKRFVAFLQRIDSKDF